MTDSTLKERIFIRDALIAGLLVVCLLFFYQAHIKKLKCDTRPIGESIEYVKERLINLEDITYYEDIPSYGYAYDFIKKNASVNQMVHMCMMFEPLCNDMIRVEVENICYE